MSIAVMTGPSSSSSQLGHRLGESLELALGPLPYSTGIEAPTATTTTTFVPKNIDGDAVYGANRNGASTPANIRANDSPKKCPRPRSAVGNCSERYTRTAGKNDSTATDWPQTRFVSPR